VTSRGVDEKAKAYPTGQSHFDIQCRGAMRPFPNCNPQDKRRWTEIRRSCGSNAWDRVGSERSASRTAGLMSQAFWPGCKRIYLQSQQ